MKFPNFNEEKKLWKQGLVVAGLDEAGRGPLAGPVVAAAVVVRQIPRNKMQFPKIDDSKKLSAAQREFFYEKLIHNENVRWGIGVVSEKIIDKINILEATKLAMKKAVKNLNADFLLIDGNFTLNPVAFAKDFGAPKQKSIIKGDQRVFSIAAASIIAKVTRDRIMRQMHKKYPEYGFDRHKGYGTAAHLLAIENFGPCKIHRKTFWPISDIAKNEFI